MQIGQASSQVSHSKRWTFNSTHWMHPRPVSTHGIQRRHFTLPYTFPKPLEQIQGLVKGLSNGRVLPNKVKSHRAARLAHPTINKSRAFKQSSLPRTKSILLALLLTLLLTDLVTNCGMTCRYAKTHPKLYAQVTAHQGGHA